MDNVYDMLFDKKLIHIIPDCQIDCEVPDIMYQNTAIAVNLFYEDTLHRYFTYLDNIPKEIPIYIYSSNENVWCEIARYADRRENCFFTRKENRGRDISSFLVAFREIALKKKFLCFLHDKKEKAPYLKKDTDYWVENLWSNTVGSETYIKNVLRIFHKKSNIGILSPPIPFGENISYWYTNQWGEEDLILARKLADRLKLKCDICREKMPITLGSVFWCRTEAIKKVLEYNWKYEDFPDEPLPSDGTISHAVERIFAYAAQDTGFTTEWILCPKYAGSLILKSQVQMEKTYRLLKKNYIARNLAELKKFDRQKERIEQFCLSCKKVYLYGAGEEGRKLAGWIYRWGLTVDGFIVTQKSIGQQMVFGMPVYEFRSVEMDKTVGIIIATGPKFCHEIEETIIRRGGIKYYKLIDNF